MIKLTALWYEKQCVTLVRINPSDETVTLSSAIYTDREGFSDLMISIYKASRRHTKIHYYYYYHHHHHHHQNLRISSPNLRHKEDSVCWCNRYQLLVMTLHVCIDIYCTYVQRYTIVKVKVKQSR